MVIDIELNEFFPEPGDNLLGQLSVVSAGSAEIKPCGVIKGLMLKKMQHQLDDDFRYLSDQCEQLLEKSKNKKVIN